MAVAALVFLESVRMDSATLHRSWQSVCEAVKNRPEGDPAQVTAFFSRLQPQAMSEGFLMLTADNDFIRRWVETHYREPISQALQTLFGMPFTVVIEVSEPTDAPVQATAPAPAPISTPVVATPPVPVPQEAEPAAPPADTTLGKPNVQENTPAGKTSSALTPHATLTFENFVVGDSNHMAYSMALSVAEQPGKTPLNPLFIYGRSGLGKTHLMKAIQNYIFETQPYLNTLYIDAAELLSEYMEASAAHDKEKLSFKNFKTRYEEADVLLVDDIQYLQGKTQTLNMFFQIFNNLIQRGKQIVLSADRAPKNIDIDERYHSRFGEGGIVDIQPPELETKLGIVKLFISEYAKSEGMPDFTVPQEIQTYIAEISSSNIRELKSAVTKVIYQMTFFHKDSLTIDEVHELLQNHFSGGPSKNLTVEDIQKEVEGFYKISHSDLVGPKRARNVTYPRHVAIYLCRQILDLPFTYIAKKFNRDHTTAMHSVYVVEDQIKSSREFQEELDTLRKLIREA